MRLEDELRHVLQGCHQLRRLLRRIGDDVGMAELDAGLNDDSDGAGKGGIEAEA